MTGRPFERFRVVRGTSWDVSLQRRIDDALVSLVGATVAGEIRTAAGSLIKTFAPALNIYINDPGANDKIKIEMTPAETIAIAPGVYVLTVSVVAPNASPALWLTATYESVAAVVQGNDP